MMRAIIINKKTSAYKLVEDQNLYTVPESDEDFIWLDSLAEDRQQERDILSQKFNISPLAINDAQRDRHPPKFESFREYKFLLIKAFDAKTKSIDFNILHISFFISKKFLITVHNGVSPSIDHVWEGILGNAQQNNSDPYAILYLILKKIIDRYTSVILSLESRLEEIEHQMVEKPSDELLGELIRYSTKSQYLYRIFNNQDIVIKEMLALDTNLKVNELTHKFQDVQEHMERLAGLTGLLNEVTKNLIDGYISVSGHRLNNIMKILTIVALIFMPVTFVAGIYGMNFEHMPELSYKYSYYVALAFMAILVIGLILLFKKIKWI